MRVTRQRSGAHPEALAESIAGKLCCGGHDDAGLVGGQPKDDPSRRDHATARRRSRKWVSSSWIEYFRSTGHKQ